ncbi:MAG: metallophosphoesterase [Solirubrobacteraceae bacterium]
MRILHISDLHARVETPAGQHLLVEKLLDDLQRLEQERRIDLVVFSGDCAFDGKPEGFQVARKLLLDPLHELLPQRDIVLVPGNHDVDHDMIDPIVERGMQDLFVNSDAVEQLLSEERSREQALRRLSSWQEFHKTWYGEQAPRALPLLGHLHECQIDGVSVGVAALNTAWRSSSGDDRGRLMLGEQQMRDASSALDAHDLRIVAMHHPLEWLADFDESICRQLIELNRCFVLTGHEHKSNPAAQTSARGSAVYSRAGCLYERRSYSNSYTLLELDVGSHRAVARIRRWWPERDAFGVAEDLVEGGVVELPWPSETASLPAPALPTAEVLASITTIAREVSVIVSSPQLSETASLEELLIPPTFWSLPDDEARVAQEFTDVSPEPVDPLPKIDATRVTIVSGSESSGVTSALLWLLDAHFRGPSARLPRYLRIDSRISTGRLNQALIPNGEHEDPIPLLIAIDDVIASDQRGMQRLQRFIESHPEAHFVLGCHGEAHRVLARQLGPHVSIGRVFLHPLRRRDLRALAARVYGDESRELIRRVMAVLDSQRLPRNALNMAALVVVAAREPNLDDVNETGLFDAYVSFLLEGGHSTAIASGAIDQRLREAFLERFAHVLVQRGTTHLLWTDAEQFVLDFVRKVGWAERGSPARLLDAFIESRVLINRDGEIGFRHGALRDLFAAKWMLSNNEFASEVLADCLKFPDIIRHASGLRRDRPDFLSITGEAVRAAAARITQTIDVSGFDEVRSAVALLPDPLTDDGSEQSVEILSEAELDAAYDEVESPPPFLDEDSGLRSIDTGLNVAPRELLSELYALLAAVLKNSELVEDLDLKARELREVIHGWSALTMSLLRDAEAVGELTELLAGAVGDTDEKNEGGRAAMTEQFAAILILALLAGSLDDQLGTRRLHAALVSVLDDEEFMDVSLHALFAVLLYIGLGLSDWPARVKAVFDRHGKHALVATMLTQWSLFHYRTEEFSDRHKTELESFLADVLVATDGHSAGPTTIVTRSRNRAQVLDWLRRERMRAQHRLKASEDGPAEPLPEP